MKKYKSLAIFLGILAAVVVAVSIWAVSEKGVSPRNVVIGILIVAAVVVTALYFARMDEKRRAVLRTFYVNGNICYNRLDGDNEFEDADELITIMEEVLEGIDYRGEVKDPPEGFYPIFSVNMDEYDFSLGFWPGVLKVAKTGESYPFYDRDTLMKLLEPRIGSGSSDGEE